MKRFAAVALLLGLAACAGPGGTSPSGGLMYRVPDQPSLTYMVVDSSNVDIDAGAMGSFRMQGISDATVAMRFAPAEGGVQVTASFQELSASLSQPMGGAQSATESDIQGDVVFTLDRSGRSTLVTMPEMRGVAEQLANPITLVHDFFPRLPGGAAAPGTTWTDTIKYDFDTEMGGMSSSRVVSYTLQGDTVVDGATLLKVTFQGTGDVTGTGMTEGMEIIQIASGDVSGTFLWDPARAVLVWQETHADMTGSVEVPGAGVPPMPMSIRGHSMAQLQGS